MIGEPVPKLQEILEIQDDDGGHLEIIFFTSMIFVVRLPTIWSISRYNQLTGSKIIRDNRNPRWRRRPSWNFSFL